ncbi:MAG: biofilm regulation phosphoprotein SiaC [Abitibacteriaceae bacterium]|nr:biofilm regulation phosphoprotein SiaC [Abditibacteriaceae bacterium]MBV9865866.1 biofilm regulation phosphoprotein SiaC [Abditibacteriaceae bacterium]
MNDLNIIATQATPSIITDAAAGTVEMRGDSYPENSFEFFTPILEWVKQHLAAADAKLHMNLYLLYLNTSSVKAMMDIFDMLEAAHGLGQDVSVSWYYDAENERISELAEEFKEDCTFPFNIVRLDAASNT